MDEPSTQLSSLLRLLADQGRSPQLLSDIGATYFSLGDLRQSLFFLDESVALAPGDGRTHYNRALALAGSGRTLEAIEAYRRALQLMSGDAPLTHSCRWNLSKLLLACGAYPEGWALYEARRFKPKPLPLICHPGCECWQPWQPVAGRLILIAEQGLGDVFQFLRFIPSLQAFTSALLVVVPENLVSLLGAQHFGVHVCSPEAFQPQPTDRFWPLLSIPSLFGLGPEGAAWQPPYLQAPAERLDIWLPLLQRSRQFLVAINWQGNPRTEIQELKGRSLPLELLAPLAQIPGVELLALQQGAGVEQLSACSFLNRFHPAQDAVSQAADFLDTAAILACCDLLISSDTALVHLAGALGVPTWVLLHNTPDWRWGFSGNTCSWYPTLRLFRQERPADWPSLIERVQTALQQFCSEPSERSAALPRLNSMTFVDGWQQDVQALWDRDQRTEAIQLLLSRINGCLPDRPLVASKQFALYLFLLGQYQACEQVLLDLRRRWPDNLELLETQAVVCSRLGHHQQAVEGYEAVLRMAPGGASVNLWDGLANSYSKLGKYSEAVAAGEQALRLKDAETCALPHWQLPAGSPQEWLEGHPGASVVAFSLWGSNPRYLRGLLRNLLLIPELYPGWTARVYLDRSVPLEFRTLAESLGAQLCLQPDTATPRERLCWRFQVANDASVGRFLVRDTDSVVNQREARAVQQWIESDRWFHVMRDWWTHTDLVLAGMWGGVAGVLPDLMELLRSYTPAARETPNVDQWFLRDCLWDALRRSVLSHDRCYRTLSSQPWPDPDPKGDQHVGQDEFSAHRTSQRDWLWPWIQAYPCLQLQEDAGRLRARALDAAAVPDGFVVHAVTWTPSGEVTGIRGLDGLDGFYINLDQAKDRRKAMDEQLIRLDLGMCYERFPAKTATLEEAKIRGLRSAGELGIWRSTLSLLKQWLSRPRAPGDLLHILEDDAVLSPLLMNALTTLRQGGACDWDMLFTESFLSVPLYRQMIDQRKNASASLQLINGGCYLACLSSYFLTGESARKLLKLLSQEFDRPMLRPLDECIRHLVRTNKLCAMITLPFLTTIEVSFSTSIQGFRESESQRSQQLDLFLRRMLYVHTESPEGIAQAFLEAMSSVTTLFSSYEQQILLAEMIGGGRDSGLLTRY